VCQGCEKDGITRNLVGIIKKKVGKNTLKVGIRNQKVGIISNGKQKTKNEVI
jgi:GTPase Era involved in 16S rRNA processing